MKKYILISIVVIFFFGLYLFYFSPSERRAKVIRDKMYLIKIGMEKSEVIEILSQPDDIYVYDSSLIQEGDTVKVLHYELGFGSPDALRILVKNNRVTDIISHN